MATQAEVAAHLDLSQQAVSKLKNQSVISAGAGGRGYDLDVTRVAYIRHLRNSAAGRDSSKVGSLEAERARLAREQADKVAMDNAERRKELASLPDMTGAVIGVISLAVTELQKVGMIVAKGDHKLRRRIEMAVDDALENLSATRVIEIATGGAGIADEPDEGDDA